MGEMSPRRRRHSAGFWLAVAGYLVLVSGFAWSLKAERDETNDRLAAQAETSRQLSDTVDAICETDARTRQGLADVINRYLGADVPDDPTADQSTRDRIARSNASKDGARALLAAYLPPELCRDGMPPPPTPDLSIPGTGGTTGG
jgi:hypothetical protein